MKYFIITVLSLILCCAIVFGLFVVYALRYDANPYVPEETIHIEGAENYDGNHYIYNAFLPSELPDTAIEIIYSDYHIYDQTDIYLELKFSNCEDMEQYINQIKEQIGEKLFMKENPQDASYTDCFDSAGTSMTGGKHCDYYRIYMSDGKHVSGITMGYNVMSFSYEELTVVTTSMLGISHDFVPYKDNSGSYKIPKYFTRFGIDVTKDSEYYVYFPES